jgi:hypothetical protein
MKIVLLIVVVVLGFLFFRGSADKPAESTAAPKSERLEQSSQTTGAAPSPANDPNMHNSPTRRLGF